MPRYNKKKPGANITSASITTAKSSLGWYAVLAPDNDIPEDTRMFRTGIHLTRKAAADKAVDTACLLGWAVAKITRFKVGATQPVAETEQSGGWIVGLRKALSLD